MRMIIRVLRTGIVGSNPICVFSFILDIFLLLIGILSVWTTKQQPFTTMRTSDMMTGAIDIVTVKS